MIVKEEEVEEKEEEANVSSELNNDLCNARKIMKIINEDEKEIITDLDCSKYHILEGNVSDIAIQKVVIFVDHKAKEDHENSLEEINEVQMKTGSNKKTS